MTGPHPAPARAPAREGAGSGASRRRARRWAHRSRDTPCGQALFSSRLGQDPGSGRSLTGSAPPRCRPRPAAPPVPAPRCPPAAPPVATRIYGTPPPARPPNPGRGRLGPRAARRRAPPRFYGLWGARSLCWGWGQHSPILFSINAHPAPKCERAAPSPSGAAAAQTQAQHPLPPDGHTATRKTQTPRAWPRARPHLNSMNQ